MILFFLFIYCVLFLLDLFSTQIVRLDQQALVSTQNLNQVWSTPSSYGDGIQLIPVSANVPFSSDFMINWTSSIGGISSIGSQLILKIPTSIADLSSFSHVQCWLYIHDNFTMNTYFTVSLYSSKRKSSSAPQAFVYINWKGWKKITLLTSSFQYYSSSYLKNIDSLQFGIYHDLENPASHTDYFLIGPVEAVTTSLYADVGSMSYVLPRGQFSFEIPILFNGISPLLGVNSDVNLVDQIYDPSRLNSLGITSITLKNGNCSFLKNNNHLNLTSSVIASLQMTCLDYSIGSFSLEINKTVTISKSTSVNSAIYLMLSLRNPSLSIYTDILIQLMPSGTDYSFPTKTIGLSVNASMLNQYISKDQIQGIVSNFKLQSFPNSLSQSVFLRSLSFDQTGFFDYLQDLFSLALYSNLDSFQDRISVANYVLKSMQRITCLYPTLSVTAAGTQYTMGDTKLSNVMVWESLVIIRLCMVFDLVAPYASPQIISFIGNNLIALTGQAARSMKTGVSNFQSAQNCALYFTGLLSNDSFLKNLAIEDPLNGIKFQLSNAINYDGFWAEGSPDYHFSALVSISQLAIVAFRVENINLLNYDGFTKRFVQEVSGSSKQSIWGMFMGPTNLVLPNIGMPSLNDSPFFYNFFHYLPYYEIALGAYPNSNLFASILALGPRSNDPLSFSYSLGFDTLVKRSNKFQFPSESYLVPSWGFSILRNPLKDYVGMKAGLYGGWHGHLDKLSFVFYSNNMYLVVDPGSGPYSSDHTTSFIKKTLSHSTLMINGENQLPSEGKNYYFAEDISNSISGIIYQFDGIGPIEAQRTIHLQTFSFGSSLSVDIAFPYTSATLPKNFYLNVEYVLHSRTDGVNQVTSDPNDNPIILDFDYVNYTTALHILTGSKSISDDAVGTWKYISNPRVFDIPNSEAKNFLFSWSVDIWLKCGFEIYETSLFRYWSSNIATVCGFSSEGECSLLWMDPTIPIILSHPITNWSKFSIIVLDVFSSKKMQSSQISIRLYSGNTNNDFFLVNITMDWSGYWKKVEITSDNLLANGRPYYSQIKKLEICYIGPLANNFQLYLDNFGVYDFDDTGSAVPLSITTAGLKTWQASYKQRNRTIIGFESTYLTSTLRQSIVSSFYLNPSYIIVSKTPLGLTLIESTCSDVEPFYDAIDAPLLPFINIHTAYQSIDIESACANIFLANAVNFTDLIYSRNNPIYIVKQSYWIINTKLELSNSYYLYDSDYPFSFLGSISMINDDNLSLLIRGIDGPVCFNVPYAWLGQDIIPNHSNLICCMEWNNLSEKLSLDLRNISFTDTGNTYELRSRLYINSKSSTELIFTWISVTTLENGSLLDVTYTNGSKCAREYNSSYYSNLCYFTSNIEDSNDIEIVVLFKKTSKFVFAPSMSFWNSIGNLAKILIVAGVALLFLLNVAFITRRLSYRKRVRSKDPEENSSGSINTKYAGD